MSDLLVGLDFHVEGLNETMSSLSAVAKQVPFAAALAMNRTQEEVQEAVRQRIRQRGFTIRSATTDQWLNRQVYFGRGERATKEKLSATVRIQAPSISASRKSLLDDFEDDFTRRSRLQIGAFPSGMVAVPIRRSPSEVIPRELYPMNVGLQLRRDPAGNLLRAGRGTRSRSKLRAAHVNSVMKGTRGTFLVASRGGLSKGGLLLQRTGPGKDGVRALFAIVSPFEVEGRHYFYETALPTALARWETNMEAFLAFAIATAR